MAIDPQLHATRRFRQVNRLTPFDELHLDVPHARMMGGI